MRRLILVLPLSLLVMAPTAVRAADGDLVVCDAPPAGTTVLNPGTTTTIEVDSPATPDESVFLLFQLDLYPAKATNKASVNASLNWQIQVNDYDMYLTDPDGNELASENFQALGDPPTESAGGSFLHCSMFSIEVYNFLAAGGPQVDMVDPLQLTIATGAVK